MNVIVFSAFLGLIAVIGLAFLGSGLELIGRAVRTTATVTAIHNVTDFGLAKTGHTEFTLQFSDQGRLVTEQTDQVRQVPAAPAVGDRIQVYYVPGDPSDVTDVRYGRPGSYDFEMGAAFCGIAIAGWTGLTITRVRAKRRMKAIDSGL